MNFFKDEFGNIKKINLLLLALVISVTPLIYYLRLVIISGTPAREYWGSFVEINFHSFYKMSWLIFMGILIFVLSLAYMKKQGIIKSIYYIPLGTYGILAVLSSLFSEYPYIVRLGAPSRHEGIFVLLIYLLLTAAAINILREKSSIKFVLGALFTSAFVLGIHGLLQYIGYDLFATEFGSRLITPLGLESYVDNISFLGEGRVYSTLGNPNFIGSYGAIVVTLLLGLYITAGKRIHIYSLGFLNVLMFAYMLGSHSRAGMIGFLAGSLLLIILLHRQIRNNWRRVLVILTAFLLVFLSMDVYSADDLFGDIVSPATETELIEEELIAPPITGVSSEGNQLVLETSEVEMNISKGDGGFEFYDENMDQLNYYSYPVTSRYRLQSRDYEAHTFELNPADSRFTWFYNNKEANFKYEDGEFLLRGIYGEYYEIREVPSWGFDGYERLGSSRGYIWSRTLPLLQDTILIGHGPDNFGLYFPQDDVVGKLKFGSTPGVLAQRPHNMYLQTAVNTGVLSLIALLGLWGYYLLQSLRLYWKADYKKWECRVGAGIMAGVAGYLVAGIFNDSSVSVAPVFWILLGMGISINLLLKRKA